MNCNKVRGSATLASMDTMITIDLAAVGTILATVIGTGAVVCLFMWRIAARLDRRIDNDRAESAADRRAFQAAMDAFRAEMRTFEREMLRLAERQSHVEGRLDERGSVAD